MLEWINKRNTFERMIKRIHRVEKLLEKTNKELHLIRIFLGMKNEY